jgi:hypothetical protein
MAAAPSLYDELLARADVKETDARRLRQGDHLIGNRPMVDELEQTFAGWTVDRLVAETPPLDVVVHEWPQRGTTAVGARCQVFAGARALDALIEYSLPVLVRHPD